MLTTSHALDSEVLECVQKQLQSTDLDIPQMLGFRARSTIAEAQYVSLTSVFHRFDGEKELAVARDLQAPPIFVGTGQNATAAFQQWVANYILPRRGHQDHRPWVVASNSSTVGEILSSARDNDEPWLCAVPEAFSTGDEDKKAVFEGFRFVGGNEFELDHIRGDPSESPILFAFATQQPLDADDHVDIDEDVEDDAEDLEEWDFFDDDMEHEQHFLSDEVVLATDLTTQLFGDMAFNQKNDDNITQDGTSRRYPAQEIWLTSELDNAVSPLEAALDSMDHDFGIESFGQEVSDDDVDDVVDADEDVMEDWDDLSSDELPPVLLGSADSVVSWVTKDESLQCLVHTGKDRPTDILLHKHISEGVPMVLPLPETHDFGDALGSVAALAWIKQIHRLNTTERSFEVDLELGKLVTVHRKWTCPQTFGVEMAEISIVKQQ